MDDLLVEVLAGLAVGVGMGLVGAGGAILTVPALLPVYGSTSRSMPLHCPTMRSLHTPNIIADRLLPEPFVRFDGTACEAMTRYPSRDASAPRIKLPSTPVL